MYNQLRAPERLFKIGQWIIAALFAFFLIQVGSSLIGDLPSVGSAEVTQERIEAQVYAEQQIDAKGIKARVKDLEQEQQSISIESDQLDALYQKERESFENWKSTRSATEASSENPEVIQRARVLDSLLQKKTLLERRYTDKQAQIDAVQLPITQAQSVVETRLEAALRSQELKHFGIRLAFVLPLLALALWLFRRYRRTEYWPFVWGYIFASLFAFFFELVPYLPSFGGYIRWGVGVVLTFVVGRWLIKALQQYVQRKQAEQTAPQEARKQDIQYEKALTTMSKGHCPSCERPTPSSADGALVNFCMHCGLHLFKNCAQCHTRHNAFYSYCPACGHHSPKQATADAAGAS